MDYQRVAGALIVIMALFIVSAVLYSQSIYPNYNLNINYISDLGNTISTPAATTHTIFNPAIIIFGIVIACAALLIYKAGKHKLIAIAILLSGVGAIGVGLFPENTGSAHIVSALFAFGFIAIAAVGSVFLFKGWLKYYSLLAGLLALAVLSISFLLTATGATIAFGLGHGGFEEILFYDDIIWAIALGLLLATKRL